jgi:hypothetical protein
LANNFTACLFPAALLALKRIDVVVRKERLAQVAADNCTVR